MKIKPNSDDYGLFVLFTIVFALGGVAAWLDEMQGLSIIFLFSYLFGAIPDIMLKGKTILLDKDGCTVSLLGISRHYTWDQYTVREIGDYSCTHTGGKFWMGEAAWFSRTSLKRPRWMDPMLFGSFCRPFSTFFVTFPWDPQKKKDNGYRVKSYPVHRDEFLAAMAEWGVELQDFF